MKIPKTIWRFGLAMLLVLMEAPLVDAQLIADVSGPASPRQSVSFDGFGFIENRGQVDPAVRFYAQLECGVVFFNDDALVYDLTSCGEEPSQVAASPGTPPVRQRHAVWMKFVEPGPFLRVEPQNRLPAELHFLKGTDREEWASGVPAYSQLIFRDVSPGIDIVYWQDSPRSLRYEFVIKAHGDPGRVRFSYNGADRIDRRGQAERLATTVGYLAHRRPAANTAGTIEFTSRLADVDEAQAGDVSSAASERSLTDLGWSTFLDGITARGVAFDGSGNPVVTGSTNLASFPATPGAYDESLSGAVDAFVAKLAVDGSSFVWATFLGGSGSDEGRAIDLDGAGNVVVAGTTTSADFPHTGAVCSGSFLFTDAFLTKLTPDGGQPIFSRCIARSDENYMQPMAVDIDGIGSPVVVGWIGSTSPGREFVKKFAVDGSLLWEFGFPDSDSLYISWVTDVVLDGAQNVLLAGGIRAANEVSASAFATENAYDETCAANYDQNGVSTGCCDAFLAKLSPDGGTMHWASFLGGGGGPTDCDMATGVDVDGSGNPVVVGVAEAPWDFPLTTNAVDRTGGLAAEGFITKFTVDGGSLIWSTFLGGSEFDRVEGIDLDSSGRPVVVGVTFSQDFPVVAQFDDSLGGASDYFVSKLTPDASAFLWSTYLGGSGAEGEGLSRYAGLADLAVPGGEIPRAVVAGKSSSSDFPLVNPVDDTCCGAIVAQVRGRTGCVDLGEVDPVTLLVRQSTQGRCPEDAPAVPEQVDVVVGDLGQLGVGTIGEVEPIACGVSASTFEDERIPAPNTGLFYLMRHVGGSYTDAGGTTLIGTRTPSAGDCP
ncbi:MAG TPA: SBBP repeat-containing protein [Vicinamibacteria bacterium]|nr:SBBP repeat-containing protein [Vicinamibacteria bacterium]